MTGSSPAADTAVTEKGMVLGMYPYMSPEQVQGKEVDQHRDTFSLGAVLYEMVTGKRAFDGKSQVSVAAAILDDEPAPILSVKPTTSAVLDHAIVCSLAKNPEDRRQTARDLALELRWATASGSQTGIVTAGAQRKAGRQWLPWGVAALLGLTVMLSAIWFWGKRPPVKTPVRFEVQLPGRATGRFLLYTQKDPRTHGDLWVLPTTENGTARGPAAPFANTEFSEGQGRFSPHAHWLRMYRTSRAGTKSMYNRSRRLRTEEAKRRSPAMVAAGPTGGGMVRNCSIWRPTE